MKEENRMDVYIDTLRILQLILPSPFYMLMVSDVKLSVAEVHGCT